MLSAAAAVAIWHWTPPTAMLIFFLLVQLLGYSHLSDTEAPIIPTNSKAPEIPTVFLVRLP